MEQGYIRLYRKIMQKGWYKNSKYVHLWAHLLLKANHQPNEFFWNGETIKVKEGQFISGRKQLSDETGLAQSTIEKILKLFEKEHQIEQQKTTKFRLIIILKWRDYQNCGQQKEQQRNNRGTTEEQQRDTNKNDKNEKNEKNEKKREVAFAPPSLSEVSEYCKERNNGIEANNFIDFYSSKGWMVGKNKMKDWRACVRTWEGRNSKESTNSIYSVLKINTKNREKSIL